MTREHNPPLLEQELASLQPSARARRALEGSGITTVGDFVRTTRDSFLARPGCGEGTYAELERRVCRWLAERLGDPDALLDDRRPLAPLIADTELASRLEQLGARTVGELQSLPPSATASWKPKDKRKLKDLHAAIQRTRRLPPAAAPLLPTALHRLPLRTVGVPIGMLLQFENLGCTTVGHALLLPAAIYDDGGMLGPQAASALRCALEQLFRAALEQLEDTDPERAADWPTLRGRLLAPLDEEERDWLCERIGLGYQPHSQRELARTEGLTIDQISARDESVRTRLGQRAPSLLYRLRHELLRELDAFEGVARTDRLAVGSWLHTLAKGSGDAGLPLRLCAFCFPTEVHLHGGVLTTLGTRAFTHLHRLVRSLTVPRQLPRPLEEIAHRLQQENVQVPRGVLLHVVTDVCRLRITIDPGRGEVVEPQPPALSTRLAELLHEHGRPTRVDDLLYDYRERYRTARRQRLLAQLRRDSTFLQLAPDVWSLRCWHGDELESARARAEQVVNDVCERGGKQRVFDLVDGDVRTQHLVLDLVRRDRRLRYLGRGEVCASGHGRSQVLHDLLRDFRKAMGEVPMSRFVANQPEHKRRLVRRLLVENRLFVFPAPDRIDVLTNYPFNPERLQRLTLLVDEFLAQRNGYAPLESVLAEVNNCDLGGSWLHPTLLGELLRRHGPFEVLPGGFVARSTLGLGGWLMRRARNALREAAIPISVQELLAERPELAEFASCLEQLLHKDPLVQTPDGTRFQIA